MTLILFEKSSSPKRLFLNGRAYVSKQECRLCQDTYPHEIQKHLMHLKKVIILCGLSSDIIIGTYCFENDVGQVRITNFFRQELDDHTTHATLPFIFRDLATCNLTTDSSFAKLDIFEVIRTQDVFTDELYLCCLK